MYGSISQYCNAPSTHYLSSSCAIVVTSLKLLIYCSAMPVIYESSDEAEPKAHYFYNYSSGRDDFS